MQTKFSDADPMFSPNGKWLAYQSNECRYDSVREGKVVATLSQWGGVKWRYGDCMTGYSAYTDIADRHGIVLLLQFGSTVTGKSHAGSDVDIAVLFDRPSLALEELGVLQSELQAIYLERLVDLVVLNRADPLLLKQVTASCNLLYGSQRDLHELKIRAFKQFQDHRRFFEMERDYVDRAIRERTTP